MQGQAVSRGELLKASFVIWIGTTIDVYDFFIGTTSAGLIWPRVFFPPEVDPTLRLIYTLLTIYLITFIFRPVGAFMFGHIGDRLGRKISLMWTLVLMGIGALLIGFAPDYATAGYLGLLMAFLGRLIHGIGVGGELGGGITLLTEQADAAGSRHRAFWASWTWVAAPVALIWASGFLAYLSAMYPGDSFYAFGWRVAYYVGAAVAVVGVVLRWILLESALFEQAKKEATLSRAPAVEVLRNHWREVLLGALIFAVQNTALYVTQTYGPTFLNNIGVPRDLALLTVTAIGVAALFFIPFWAVMADKFGRKLIIILVNMITIPISVAYPLMLLSKNSFMVFIGQALPYGIVQTGVYATTAAFLPEQFPTRYRYSGSGLALNIGAIMGGGIAPILVATLVGTAYAERWWAISLVLVTYAVAALLATLPLKETAREKLRL